MNDDVHAGSRDLGPGFDPEPVPVPGGALPATFFDPLTRRVAPWLPTRAARTWAAVFAVVALVHLGAHLVIPTGHDVARVSQWLLMPPLAAALWCSTPSRSRLVSLTVLALLCSWAGDVVPAAVPDDVSFFVLMALFLCAQVVYLAAFAPFRGRSALARPAFAALYVLLYLVVVGTVAARALSEGVEALPFVVGLAVYGAALVTMAALASGVDRLAGLGGILFLVSDGMIGIGQVMPGVALLLPPGTYSFLVMLTYVAAQTLIAAGVRRRVRGAA